MRCERCGMDLDWAGGSHYHCGGCDSTDTTSMLGHFTAIHMVNGKIIEVPRHHHTVSHCELEESK